jgi:hypothetical protein
MALSPAERKERVRRYVEGPSRLKAALASVPDAALQWRPAAGKWSAHEVVVHCADSETNGAGRLRYVLAEKEPLIVGYDQESWARVFDYHQHPLQTALSTIEAVRANTAALLQRLPDDAWGREGRHTESGRYTVDDWLDTYAEHLEKHAKQIERNVAAWTAGQGTTTSVTR